MTRTFSAAQGERVYAIGDVHGRWDLLQQLLELVRIDDERRAPSLTRLILLGDVVDRGPDSKAVVRELMLRTRSGSHTTVLMGNHEQLMWRSLTGDSEAFDGWLQVGGVETLSSFGVAASLMEPGQARKRLAEARRRIGAKVMVWLERLPMIASSGDLVFVHAGMRPGVGLAAQSPRDLLWIRSAFTESDETRPFLVVHGHSVTPDGPDVRPNRVGLDTGAFSTGRLTAMGFEKTERWVLHT